MIESASTVWDVQTPDEWPLPKDLNVSFLLNAESCPRRWALMNSAYPRLWDRKGYPRIYHVNTLIGLSIHRSMEILARSFVESGCKSSQDDKAIMVIRQLGGFSNILSRSISQIMADISNPRMEHLKDDLTSDLERQLPAIRERFQAMVCETTFIVGQRGAPRDARSTALGFGSHLEVSLRNGELNLAGRADLINLESTSCEIADFKTGSPKPEHEYQLKVYALLWLKDGAVNPTKQKVTQLTLIYPGKRIQVAVPNEDAIAEIERDLVRRASLLQRDFERSQPTARPAKDTCAFCPVRQLCEPFWETISKTPFQAANEQFADAELEINGKRSNRVWDATVTSSSLFTPKTKVVLTIAEKHVGADTIDRSKIVRVLNGYFVSDEKSQTVPAITVGKYSEVFHKQ